MFTFVKNPPADYTQRRPGVGFIATPQPAAPGFPWLWLLIGIAAAIVAWRILSPTAQARRAALTGARRRYDAQRARIAARFT